MRGKLPHWEVAKGRYFVTVRCVDSLPAAVVNRLHEVQQTLARIQPASRQFSELQRQYFRTAAKYLDAGLGGGYLARREAAYSVVNELTMLGEWEVDVFHFTIMPNHWHALIEPREACSHSLSDIVRRIKGRSARNINLMLGREGPLWQREWFDRWMRDDAEYARCVRYIRANPIRGGLSSAIGEHRWTR